MMRVGILGVGAVGAMLARAHVRYGRPGEFTLAVANRSTARLRSLAELAERVKFATVEEAAATADLFFACVPSSALPEVAAATGSFLRSDAVFVCTSSVARLSDLARLVRTPIVRVVPSILHAEGRGASLVVAGPRATPAALDAVCRFLAPFSVPRVVADAHARVATDITACGPALCAAFVALLAESAARRNPAPDPAVLDALARETFCGVAALLDAGWSAERIEGEVATPGGTTEAGLARVRAKLPALLDAFHDATRERQDELRAGAAG